MFTESSYRLPRSFPPSCWSTEWRWKATASDFDPKWSAPWMLPSPWDCMAGCYSVGMWCDAICIQRKAPVWSPRNGIQVFHIGIDPFRAGGERRETSTLKWVYLRLFADLKNLVQDANGRDLSVRIESARQLCYWAPFTNTEFKETSALELFY